MNKAKTILVWDKPLPKGWSRCIPNHHEHEKGTNKKLYSPEYMSWLAMIWRCYYKKHPAYNKYGGAGIRVVESWISFENFLNDMGHRPKGTSINRINGAVYYGPDTCEWATLSAQSVDTKLSSTNRSGYRGVSYYAPTNKWTVRIQVKGKSKNCGYFLTKEEAALKYNELALYYYGPLARLNVIGEPGYVRKQ